MTITASQLAWQCRRGMLELDVFLQRFLSEAYPQLNEEDQLLFQQLLKSDDPDLFAWLMGYQVCEEAEFNRMIQLIREHVHASI